MLFSIIELMGTPNIWAYISSKTEKCVYSLLPIFGRIGVVYPIHVAFPGSSIDIPHAGQDETFGNLWSKLDDSNEFNFAGEALKCSNWSLAQKR